MAKHEIEVSTVVEDKEGDRFEVSFMRVYWLDIEPDGVSWEDYGPKGSVYVKLGSTWLPLEDISSTMRTRIEDAIDEWCNKNEPERVSDWSV